MTINRQDISKKLNSYGMKFANIGISKDFHTYTVPPGDFGMGEDMCPSCQYNQVNTYKIDFLRDEDLSLILDALHFYSKSKNPKIEELRIEYIVMRKMMEVSR